MRFITKLVGFPLLLVLYEISTYLSNDMYLPGLPDMMRDLGLSIEQAQLTLTMWFAGSASMPLIMGMVSDRIGRRPVLIYGGFVYVAATIMCALTSNYHVLLAARYVEGCMVSTMAVAGYACIHESYEKIEAIKLLAIMASITVLAPALGPLLGSIVLLVADWRMIFWFIALAAFINLAFLTKLMPETLHSTLRVQLNPLTLLKQYVSIISNKHFIFLAMVNGFIFGGFIMWITAGPILLIGSFHYSAIEYGIVQAGVFAANMIGNHIAKLSVERLGIHYLIWLGLFITMAGGALMLLTVTMPHPMAWFVMAMTVYSFGSGLCFAVLNRSMIEATSAPMGMRVALSNVIMVSCGAIGSVVVSMQFNGSTGSLAFPIAIASFTALTITMLTRKTLKLNAKV